LQIPAVAGGGIGDVVASAAKIPLAEIGDNVRAITRQLRTLTASPQLKDSITHLDGALGELDKTLQQAGPEVAPTLRATRQTVDSLKRTAGELDATVKAARMTIGADPAAPDGSLEPALLHVSEAARSIRVLADYLDQHPEALIRGR
jgi:ABC-type transporter Mla subunit MlaD